MFSSLFSIYTIKLLGLISVCKFMLNILNMDYVVMAVGGEVDKDLIEKCNISTTTKKYVQVNENNQTSDEKVFAGGDVVGQNSTVAWAASDGKNVASKIIKFLEEK